MPTFGLSNDHTGQLVDYFNNLSKVEFPFTFFDEKRVSPEYLDAAKKLVSKDYFNCFSCHQQGDRKPEGPVEGWAPDLALARQRLNPDWIINWLKDPQKLQPGTKMPSFFPGGPDDILGGKDDRQIEALRDYIMTLGRDGRSAAPPAPVAASRTKAAGR
jgi:mono/diheme cytochrome c family protein